MLIHSAVPMEECLPVRARVTLQDPLQEMAHLPHSRPVHPKLQFVYQSLESQ